MTFSVSKKNLGRIGYILSYPLSNIEKINNKIIIQLNKLIAKLNHKYPNYFSSTSYKDYLLTTAFVYDNNLYQRNKGLISDENNLLRLKNELENLEIIICFGEKAYYAAVKVKEIYNLSYTVFKTKSISYPVSRHIKTLYSNNNHKHIRTNFDTLVQFKDIDMQFSKYISDDKSK